jgi:hypothetical protein
VGYEKGGGWDGMGWGKVSVCRFGCIDGDLVVRGKFFSLLFHLLLLFHLS